MKPTPVSSSPTSNQPPVLDRRPVGNAPSAGVVQPTPGDLVVRSADGPSAARTGKVPARTTEVVQISGVSDARAEVPTAEAQPLAGAIVGFCGSLLPYLALPRPDARSLPGVRLQGFKILDERIKKNKQILSSSATANASQRALIRRNETTATEMWDRKNAEVRRDDTLQLVKLSRAVDEFDESANANTKGKRDALSKIHVDISRRLRGIEGAQREAIATGLLLRSQTPDARFEEALDQDGSIFWELSARSACYRHLVAAENARPIRETKRPFSQHEIWEMRSVGMHHTMDLVSVPTARLRFFKTEISIDTIAPRSVERDIALGAAATVPAVGNLSVSSMETDGTLEAAFSKASDQGYKISDAVEACEKAINKQLNVLRALYASNTPLLKNEFRKLGSLSLQKLRQASQNLTEIRLFVDDFPLPSQDPQLSRVMDSEGLQTWEALHEQFVQRLDERQDAVDTLISELAEDLDTFAPAPMLPAPPAAQSSTASVSSKKKKKKATEAVATTSAASGAAEAAKTRTAAAGKAAAGPLRVPALSFPNGELPSLEARQRWFTDMFGVLEALHDMPVSADQPASRDAGELSKIHDEAVAASQEAASKTDRFLEVFTSDDRVSAVHGELMSLLKSADAHAHLALALDGQFKDVDRNDILHTAWKSYGRAAALEDLLERELPLKIGHEHVIGEAINRNLDNRFQLPYLHSPTVPDGGISVVRTVGTRRRPGGPMLRIQLDHPPGDAVRWLSANGIDVAPDADMHKARAPLHGTRVDADAWVLHYHMAEKHRDKQPEDFDISRLGPEDLSFGSSKLARFERRMERLMGHTIGRGLRHREGMTPGSLSPNLGIDLIAANKSKITQA